MGLVHLAVGSLLRILSRGQSACFVRAREGDEERRDSLRKRECESVCVCVCVCVCGRDENGSIT